MNFVPIPGVGNANLDKETNLAAWVDRLILTQNHTWKQTLTWDPEGILSTIPAIASGIFGMIIGYIIKTENKPSIITSLRLIYHGLIAVILGICFDFFFPLNKSLWSSSFVLFTSGLATIYISILYWLFDVKGYKTGTNFFLVFGLNAITVFFGSAVIAKLFNIPFIVNNGVAVGVKNWLYQTYFVSNISNPYLASLVGALIFVLIWYVILWFMNKKKVFIKI
jgi:predicted acyltransferase